MSIKAKLEARYPDEDWSQLDGGADGEYPVFWSSKGVYGINTDMWPSGLTEMTSVEIKAFLES
jgi:hypothetical protein